MTFLNKDKAPRAAIFDVDGTLVDSMSAWRAAPERFLLDRGIVAQIDLSVEFDRQGFSATCALISKNWPQCGRSDEIQNEIMRALLPAYETDFTQIPHACEYLQKLHQSGVQICVLTANLPALVEPALKRLGMTPCVSFLMSCINEGIPKSNPALFELCARRLGVSPENCVMFEDQPVALRSARQAGMRTVGVRDTQRPDRQKGLECLVDRTILDYGELAANDIF